VLELTRGDMMIVDIDLLGLKARVVGSVVRECLHSLVVLEFGWIEDCQQRKRTTLSRTKRPTWNFKYKVSRNSQVEHCFKSQVLGHRFPRYIYKIEIRHAWLVSITWPPMSRFLEIFLPLASWFSRFSSLAYFLP